MEEEGEEKVLGRRSRERRRRERSCRVCPILVTLAAAHSMDLIC